MKILILPCHSVLEYDEFKLFIKLGHEVRSIGSYVIPGKPIDKARPSIDLDYDQDIIGIDNLIDWADIILSQHRIDLLIQHSHKLKHKKIIYRSIGQCSFGTEDQLRILKSILPQIKIIRYSKNEDLICRNINKADDVIYFYKDISEFPIWNRKNNNIINIGQSIEDRQRNCGLHHLLKINKLKVYSSSIDNRLSYNNILKLLSDSACYFYTGTLPAPYTLAFMEAALIGIPVVSINKSLFGPQLETDEFIVNKENGFADGNYATLNNEIHNIISNYSYASVLSENMREFAYYQFCSDNILNRWTECIESL